jgi:hypothetical protein
MPIKRKNIFKSTPSFKKGAQVLELTDYEIEQYRKGGYIVEEYSEGGLVGDPPPGNTIYVDPNDPEGVARYEAYQDSAALYNNYIDYRNMALNTNAGTRAQIARRYNIAPEPGNNSYFHLIGTNVGSGRQYNYTFNPNDINPQILPIAGWAASDESVARIQPQILAEYKKPVQPVKYGPNLNTDLAAWLKTQGAPASYADRKKLYEQATGQTDYKGTAEQNIGLLNLVKERGLDYNINDLEKVPSNTSDKTAFVKSLSKMPERSEESVEASESVLPTDKSVETSESVLPTKDKPKGLTRRVPKTEWKQLPNGTWYPVTRAGNNASVEEYKQGGIVMELTEKQIADYIKKGLRVENY